MNHSTRQLTRESNARNGRFNDDGTVTRPTRIMPRRAAAPTGFFYPDGTMGSKPIHLRPEPVVPEPAAPLDEDTTDIEDLFAGSSTSSRKRKTQEEEEEEGTTGSEEDDEWPDNVWACYDKMARLKADNVVLTKKQRILRDENRRLRELHRRNHEAFKVATANLDKVMWDIPEVPPLAIEMVDQANTLLRCSPAYLMPSISIAAPDLNPDLQVTEDEDME